MITVIVEFKLKEALDCNKARDVFLGTANKYRSIPGLIRKYYYISQDGTKAGGVYLWQSRKYSENFFTKEWYEFILKKYGSEPVLTYLKTPVIVDNKEDSIISVK